MQCNIDARGRRLRLISGILCLIVGIVLGILSIVLQKGFWVLLLAGLALLAGGLFQVYEARKGWCAIRAMGIKTPV
jgi:uncharacterized membrane protein HdeD (DUF308 family)